jgi:hypothetical protein
MLLESPPSISSWVAVMVSRHYALALALDFDTWRILVRQQSFTNDQAVELRPRRNRQ